MEQNKQIKLAAIAADLAEALIILTDHAEETYPHFESERGQTDIARAKAALAKYETEKKD